MKTVGWIASSIAVLGLSVLLVFGAQWLRLEWRKYWGPKEQAVEREIFRETRSYDEGMVQQLSRFRLQYVRAEDDVEKEAILSTVRQMFAEYDPSRLPSVELENFLRKAQGL